MMRTQQSFTPCEGVGGATSWQVPLETRPSSMLVDESAATCRKTEKLPRPRALLQFFWREGETVQPVQRSWTTGTWTVETNVDLQLGQLGGHEVKCCVLRMDL